MKKVPTMFVRDPQNMSRILGQIAPGCEWVANGEGVATRKYDGTCCLVRDGKLYKRYEVKPGGKPPANFEAAGEVDETTGKIQGWVPVGDGPEDKWHREAWAANRENVDGTYELLGPKIQGNAESLPHHFLLRHKSAAEFTDTPRAFAALKEWLAERDIEGIVFHHPDGRMAKVKKKDFGLKRKPA